ncbi:phosphatidate cytidylyltransferase [Candidatus Phytoplasma melaleucae]|uniref:Phosphatidate cytidylyltransferase n=1 Tax=Candidatus Phytoplasma melaleucae TaxID=2982630 RepID=A0ABT9DD06_9MOLU|nr:phosphatidate cytidylyltransferase ['Melaleuca sp.' phytoplasma]MDO8167972.1 phosphatidate cytidylyltransferase ['Melaleuca sp.' phytoplasma]
MSIQETEKKIYSGTIMFLIASLFFYLCSYIERYYQSFLLMYTFLFIVIVFITKSTQETLHINKKLKRIIKTKTKINFLLDQFIIILLNLFGFFYFLAVIVNAFCKKNIIRDNTIIHNNLLFKILTNSSFFSLFYASLFILIFFIYFVFKSDLRTNELNNNLAILFYLVFFSACFLSLIFISYKWSLYVIIIATTSDSFAFLGGRLYGKNLLCPKLSPKKTWEGLLCGNIVATVISFSFFYQKLDSSIYLPFAILTIISAIMAQIGDLIVSKFKRDFQIKDFSNTIPGHGGLLDRFDSVLFLSFFIVLIFLNPFILELDNYL